MTTAPHTHKQGFSNSFNLKCVFVTTHNLVYKKKKLNNGEPGLSWFRTRQPLLLLYVRLFHLIHCFFVDVFRRGEMFDKQRLLQVFNVDVSHSVERFPPDVVMDCNIAG